MITVTYGWRQKNGARKIVERTFRNMATFRGALSKAARIHGTIYVLRIDE